VSGDYLIVLRLPLVIGHRGASAQAPENTLASIAAAAGSGIAWVEVDVRLTRDGVPVLLHDATVDRTTSGTGPLATHDCDRLAAFDAGRWFDPEFTDEKVPTLAEALALTGRIGLGINLELKIEPDASDPAASDRARAALADAVVTAVTRAWAARLGGAIRPPVLVSSFDQPLLAAVRTLAPRLPLGLLRPSLDQGWAEAAAELDAAAVIVDEAALEPEAIRAVTETGRFLIAYTVNDPVRARRLLSAGVTSVISDQPGQLLEALVPRVPPRDQG